MIYNILSHRTAICKVNDARQELECNDTGACQGNISAALFFIYYIWNMMKEIKSKKIKFSDDGTLYDSAKPEKTTELCIQMSNDITTIMKWTNKWRMPINLGKTKCMLFSKNGKNL